MTVKTSHNPVFVKFLNMVRFSAKIKLRMFANLSQIEHKVRNLTGNVCFTQKIKHPDNKLCLIYKQTVK